MIFMVRALNFTASGTLERLFEERERTEKEERLNRNLLNVEQELFDLKCRIEQLERKMERNE